MRSLVWMAAVSWGAMCAVGSAYAVELVDMEIRSPQGKPFIAHVNLKLTDSEWQNPESVKVELRSTSVPDYAAQVRTRLFLQPSAKLAFLRISALEPLTSEMTFGVFAAHSTGGVLTHYVVNGQTVRLKELPLAAAPQPVPLPVAPVEATVAPAQASPKKEGAGDDLNVPKGQLEVRLLDQTQGGTLKVPERSKQSDLELLAKTDSALNTNEDDQKRALTALESLKLIWTNSAGILGIKATPKKMAAAEEAKKPAVEPSPILNMTIDSTGNVSAGSQIPKLEVSQQEVSQPEVPKPEVPKPEVPKPQVEQLGSPAAPVAPVPAAEQVVENKKADDSTEESTWFGHASLFVFGLAFLLLSGWLFRNYKHKLKVKGFVTRSPWASVHPKQDGPVGALAPGYQKPNSSALDPAPAAFSVSSEAVEKSSILAEMNVPLATEDSPDFIRQLDKQESENRAANRRADLDSLEEEWLARRSTVDDEPVFREQFEREEPEWLKSEVLEYKVEPEFKNENDTRIELASAFIEIEDIEAAIKVLDQVQGSLTPEQEERLTELRKSVLQEGERES